MKRIPAIVATLFLVHCVFCADKRYLVSQIQARPISATEILVTWQVPDLEAAPSNSHVVLQLFRTREPQTGSSQLEGIPPLATLAFGTTEYKDTLPDDHEYYYTVLIRFDTNPHTPLIIPARNTTVLGVGVKKTEEEFSIEALESLDREMVSSGIRKTPLPYLNFFPNQKKGYHDKKTAPSLETNRQAAFLPPPHIFPQELSEESTGEDFILQEIIAKALTEGNYLDAEKALQDFLSIHRSKEATDRGTFYLGEILLYQGKYRQALTCFLSVQESFPKLTPRWIQAALNAYQIPSR